MTHQTKWFMCSQVILKNWANKSCTLCMDLLPWNSTMSLSMALRVIPISRAAMLILLMVVPGWKCTNGMLAIHAMLHISRKITWIRHLTFPQLWIRIQSAAFKKAKTETCRLPSCSAQYFPTPLWPGSSHQGGNEVSEVPPNWSNQASCTESVVQSLLPQNQGHHH